MLVRSNNPNGWLRLNQFIAAFFLFCHRRLLNISLKCWCSCFPFWNGPFKSIVVAQLWWHNAEETGTFTTFWTIAQWFAHTIFVVGGFSTWQFRSHSLANQNHILGIGYGWRCRSNQVRWSLCIHYIFIKWYFFCALVLRNISSNGIVCGSMALAYRK